MTGPGQISPEMIEAAAQALRDQFGNRCALLRKTRPWHALPEQLKNDYRQEAQAALSAALAVAANETRAITSSERQTKLDRF